MKKGILLVIILAVIIIILTAILFWPKSSQNGQPQNFAGINVVSPKVNEEVSSPLKITGSINGDGWTAFEAQAGTVQLLDENDNVLGTAILGVVDENWMKQFNNFEGELNFTSLKDQNGKLVFKNENASGEPSRDKTFSLPVKIKKTGETMTVKAYFNNSKLDPEASCNKVFSVERIIPKTEATGSAVLMELFKGPTAKEKSEGFSTSINEGVILQLLTIGMESGTARADFNEQLEYQVGGSCRVSAIRTQITETLKQFPTIKSVIISINGRTEDILQP
ncbi:MAG: GerMN domain-containing protein [Patescibacteria group bacterium]